jgi:hypothetical protein
MVKAKTKLTIGENGQSRIFQLDVLYVNLFQGGALREVCQFCDALLGGGHICAIDQALNPRHTGFSQGC